jgi:hypothetical protein
VGPVPDPPLIVLCSIGIDAFKTVVSQGVGETLLRQEIEGKKRHYVTPRDVPVSRLGCVLVDTGEGDDALAVYVAKLAELKLIAPPGARDSYSQAGYSLMTRHASGRLSGASRMTP